MIQSTDGSGNTVLSWSSGGSTVVPVSAWTNSDNYSFLDEAFAPRKNYVTRDAAASAYSNSSKFGELYSDQRNLNISAMAIAQNLGLYTDGPGGGATLDGVQNYDPAGAAAQVQYGFGPGPEQVVGPAGLQTSNSATYSDPTKVLVDFSRWYINVPSHYVYYVRNQNPEATHVPQGYVYKAYEQPSEGLGAYLVVGNSVTVYGYLAFGASMLTSTVYYKWFMKPGMTMDLQYVTIDPPQTCAANSASCNNVNDVYRITEGLNPIDSEKLTVTRNRRVQDGAANYDDNLVVFVNFTAFGTLV